MCFTCVLISSSLLYLSHALLLIVDCRSIREFSFSLCPSGRPLSSQVECATIEWLTLILLSISGDRQTRQIDLFCSNSEACRVKSSKTHQQSCYSFHQINLVQLDWADTVTDNWHLFPLFSSTRHERVWESSRDAHSAVTGRICLCTWTGWSLSLHLRDGLHLLGSQSGESSTFILLSQLTNYILVKMIRWKWQAQVSLTIRTSRITLNWLSSLVSLF